MGFFGKLKKAIKAPIKSAAKPLAKMGDPIAKKVVKKKKPAAKKPIAQPAGHWLNQSMPGDE